MIWVALFRGVNVGGKNPLPMKELVRTLEALGLRHVRTYIQSGNVVMATGDEGGAEVASAIATAIEARFGFLPALVLVTADELEHVVRDNPFPAGQDDPKRLHVAFLDRPPDEGGLDRLATFASPSERWRLNGRILYFWAPDGFGSSRFPPSVERLLGVTATFRNWRTVLTLRDMARDDAPDDEAGG